MIYFNYINSKFQSAFVTYKQSCYLFTVSFLVLRQKFTKKINCFHFFILYLSIFQSLSLTLFCSIHVYYIYIFMYYVVYIIIYIFVHRQTEREILCLFIYIPLHRPLTFYICLSIFSMTDLQIKNPEKSMILIFFANWMKLLKILEKISHLGKVISPLCT